MRTIVVTGGFSGTAVLDLTDALADLGDATFKVAAVAEGALVPPAVGNAAWKVPTIDTQTDPAATIAQLIDNTTAPGYYNVAVDVISGGRHEAAWAMDVDHPTRRALVQVI